MNKFYLFDFKNFLLDKKTRYIQVEPDNLEKVIERNEYTYSTANFNIIIQLNYKTWWYKKNEYEHYSYVFAIKQGDNILHHAVSKSNNQMILMRKTIAFLVHNGELPKSALVQDNFSEYLGEEGWSRWRATVKKGKRCIKKDAPREYETYYSVTENSAAKIMFETEEEANKHVEMRQRLRYIELVYKDTKIKLCDSDFEEQQNDTI